MSSTHDRVIERLKSIGPMTTKELAGELGISVARAKEVIGELHAARRVYVKGWPYTGVQRARLWAARLFSYHVDAPKPPPLGNTEWQRNYRERHKALLARKRSGLRHTPFAGLMK